MKKTTPVPESRIACQTIIFGERINDLDGLLSGLAAMGFHGIEFFQHSDDIYVVDPSTKETHTPTYGELHRTVSKYGLALLGLAGGTLKSRIDWIRTTANGAPFPLYLYLEDLDDPAIDDALSSGIELAFHAHAFTRYDRIDDASRHPTINRSGVHWLPDTAHAFIGGEDIITTISSLPVDRIKGLHVKDWDSSHGRSYHRYARGFVSLGNGDVPILDLIDKLENNGFEGWYVIEQDYSADDPWMSLEQSMRWLKTHGASSASYEPQDATVRSTPAPESADLKRVLPLLNRVQPAIDPKPLAAYYDRLAELIQVESNSCHVSLWAFSPARTQLVLLGQSSITANNLCLPRVIDRDESLCGIAGRGMQIQQRRIKSQDSKNLIWKALGEQLGASQFIAVPVRNQYNPNHVRLVIGAFENSTAPSHQTRQRWSPLAADAVRSLDIALDDICSYAAGRVGVIATRTIKLDEFMGSLADLIKRLVNCDGVSIFIENTSGERLVVRGSTGIEWNRNLEDHERSYHRSEAKHHPTARSWQLGRTLFILGARGEYHSGRRDQRKSSEALTISSDEQDDILLVPLFSMRNEQEKPLQRVIGVIRCRNKLATYKQESLAGWNYFTDDDAAIIAAIAQAAAPYTELLFRDERLVQAVADLSHEINMPINTVNASADTLALKLQQMPDNEQTRVARDLVEDIASWVQLMIRVASNAEFFGSHQSGVQLECSRVHLMGDVIAPIKPALAGQLQRRGFSVDRVTYSDFSGVPRLWIDRNRFQQVFFNLISNAIKYALPQPTDFSVDIREEVTSDFYVIHCIDMGPGIEKSQAEGVFEHGMRGTASGRGLVRGAGLGLWIVRRIVEAHGGHVAVTKFYRPTVISVFLPIRLKISPPRGALRVMQ
jgi:signal transduction histidine kinase/sugar phosphate isomerase/epimerase